jgi:dolichol-phosphate mannosyltransferase
MAMNPRQTSSSTVVSVIIPVFNEAQTLEELARRTAVVEDSLRERGIELEIVLVDDHSHDATPQVAKTAFCRPGRLFKYLRLSRNSGSHTALAAGFNHCTGACALIMAADLQDPPELIPRMLDEWQKGNDVVWAGRSRREGEVKPAASRMYYLAMRVFALPQMPATGADVVLIDRKVIDAFNAIREKHTSVLAMILWMGFRQTSIEYVKEARRSGRSKWTLSRKVKLLVDSIISFSYVPIRLMSVCGFVMALCGLVYALAVIIGRLSGWVSTGTGFAALMTVLLVGQGMILTMLGILGEYLWRTFDESRGRPRYILEEVLGFDGRQIAQAGRSPGRDAASRDVAAEGKSSV